MSARQGEMPVTLTEHKELEIYRRIFFASSDYISFSRLNDGIYIDVNPGFERLMGFKRADVIGRTSLEVGIWPESWVEQRAMYIEALRRDGMVRDYPGCLKTATGKIIDVEASATIVEIDGEQILVTIVRDVSKRKQAEEELNESTARLQFILESGQIGDWDLDIIDDTSRRSLCHDQCFGYTEPVANWGFNEFVRHVHPHDRAQVEAIFQEALTQRKALHIETRVVWPDGSVHWIAVHGNLYPAGAKPTRILGIISEITERKHAEEDLRAADRRKDEFLAMLGHELRNPLAPISAAAQLLKLDQLDAVRVRQTSKIIDRQVEHMTRLVDDLLDVSRVTRGLVTLDRQPLDIKNIVDNAVEQVHPLIESRRHHLVLHLPPESARVVGDHKRLVQVVANLLNNAAKYTLADGRIVLRIQVEAEQVVLSVIDNGIGLPQELLPRVFDLFTQAERSSDRTQGGLGLGLALVKSLVELHGGSVAVSSGGADAGCKFTVRLPRFREDNESSSTQREDGMLPQKSMRSLKLMVVDDNADAAQMLAMFLEAAGHIVVVAHDSASAFERARIDAPDVFLLDIGLPDMDGNELARRLRALPRMAQVVLIAITGYGQAQDRGNAIAAGFDHHFLTPADTARLIALLAEIGAS